ncbi:lytic transglycosylase domain-containing protein [Rubrivivax albus]|uniref:Lytic transglycosylase n=1 Tax=Rubrivivax albus TaxID=2499835 RepID=A0A3S2U809_9BURK|nr:lytic transglycosylase domain-containing protein [Rubrivivax albus]RVT50766.1 lytic transglycosylase [Rubrivivax albus]
MDTITLLNLISVCAPLVHPATALALVRAESSANPWAVGVVGGRLDRQPASLAEAVTTARHLTDAGIHFSAGLAQISRDNFERLSLDVASAFEPCRNLGAMQTVLLECLSRAPDGSTTQRGLRQGLSCYYSGNFRTGFVHGYVVRVLATAKRPATLSTPSEQQP